MCEATRQLAKAAYELDQQRGKGVIDLGKLRDMLTSQEPCEHLLPSIGRGSSDM